MSQTDIMSAIRQIAAERKIDINDILDAIKQGIKSSYREERGFENKDTIDVEIDPEKGHIAVYAKKEVVKIVEDEDLQITLKDAQKYKPKAKIGDIILIDITIEGDFGRIAAQSARQIILQKLREAEKEAVIKQFTDKVGGIISV